MGCCDEWFWLFPNVPTCCGAPDAVCCYEFTTKQCNLCAGDLGWTCGLDGHCHHDLARGTNGGSPCSAAPSLRASTSKVDCSESTCKEACECTNEHCDVEVQKCLGDAECAKVQDCAMKCGCGDDDCLLECAVCCDEWFWLFPNVPTCCGAPDAICCYEFTTKQCNLCAGDLGWTSGLDGHCHHDLARGTNGSSPCSSASLLRTSPSQVDCGAATCKEACECTNEHCDAEVQKCLGDAECAKVQTCAMGCSCGDDDCMLA